MKQQGTKLLFIISLIIQLSGKSDAQYITLPDPNFANFIASAYPAAVNGSKQLDTNVAKTITGNFNAVNKNLYDITGIEYFINITRLNLSSNHLSFLPSLDRLNQLTQLRVDTNNLSTLPDLHALTSLQILNCQYNQITSLPNMNNMSSIQQFFCHHNLLTSLPDITGMTSLNHFICSDNYFTSLPDMSTLVSLNRFLCTNTKITSADLTSIPNVKEVHLRKNNLVNFPNITGMTQLTELHVDGNRFTSLPDLSTFVNLTSVRLQNNYLTFEDLLPLASLPGFPSFMIIPQNTIGKAETFIVKEKSNYSLSAGVDLSVPTNTYTWFKDGVQIATTSSPYYNLPSVQFSQAGDYTFQITNSTPLFTGLTLYSQPLTIKVINCMDLSVFQYNLQQETCQSPILFAIDETSIKNAVPPMTYTFRNTLNNWTDTYITDSIFVKSFGIFQLTINDANNCSITLPQKITLEKKPGCDLVLYPDLNGAASSYFVNHQGKASIFDSGGSKVKELVLPNYWDGKDQQGRIVDSGYYMIIVNEQFTIPISVMRTQ